ncbi:hypothetical protein HYN59_17340 [Flavobacterium album]|uniref:Uncharacterized protein n=2 Tax=Flavobacterium album TaxID=2175091 RepID=A0A2S1R298_9FLAO|nr:hypothetical protein HYN59_17340 [Flavobacterium album]
MEETVTETTADTIAKVRPDDNHKIPELEKLTGDFIKRKKETEEKLKALSPLEANALYEDLLKQNGQALMAIEKLEEDFVINYYNYFYEGEKQITPPDSIQKKVKLLTRAKLEVWDIGEGMVEIRTVPDYYKDIFEKYVTEDYSEFIAINAEEDKALFSNDAAIAIPLEDVGKRVISWEKFIAKYPDSKRIGDAKNLYLDYVMSYLFGQDNTPVMDYESGKIYPENLADFKKFIARYPDSPTTKLINMVISNKGSHDELRETILEEIKKMGFDTSIYGGT